MKKLFVPLFLFLSVSANSQQQSQFIIGADWLNSTASDWQNVPLSDAYWNLIQSFGLNFGTLNLNNNSQQDVANINQQLTNASSHGIGIELNTSVIRNAIGQNNGVPLRRWMYQTEGNYDFYSHDVGEDFVDNVLINGAETHWSMVKNQTQVPNFWRLRTSDFNAGLAAYNVINWNQIPDGFTYYVKVRIRKPVNITTYTSVVQISVIVNGQTYSGIIYANSLAYNVWEEKYVTVFNKTSTQSSLVITDPLGITGVQDYTINPAATYTSCQIQIHWYDEVDCDLDYVVIEDTASYHLNNGVYDNTITTDVNNFANHDGLSKYKIWDEPLPENFLSVRYENRKVQGVFDGYGLPGKNALAFNSVNWRNITPAQYLAQTELQQLRSDNYIIQVTDPIPSTNQVYLTSIQNKFNLSLIDNINGLREQIQTSIRFNKPCWFTPQTQSWDFPAYDAVDLREPSAYEIKTMVNLAVCYGVKGIQYFMFSIPHYSNHQSGALGITLLANDNPNSPVPQYNDSYGNLKWETLRQLNQKLSAIGSTLMSLTWQNGYSIHLSQPTGTIISNIQSSQNGTSDGTTYVELGLFKQTDQINNNNLDFFYVVNRRTLATDQRNIAVTINKSNTIYNNWKVTEVGTSNTWTVSNTGSFTSNYQPGEGKLFKMEPVMIAGGTLAYNENIPQTTTINSGVTLTILPGVNLTFASGASLTVSGTLMAIGTTANKITFDFISPNSSSQNGIKVNNGASLYVSNAVIKNAWYGVYCNNTYSSPINNWEITNCNTGIYFYGTNVGIFNNYIHNNSMGIALYNSSPTLTLNKVSANTNYGVSSSGSTSIPQFGIGTTQGKNKISGNPVGVCAFSSSLPMLGNLWPLSGGYNTVGDNTSYNIYAITSGVIFAVNNYWGTPTPTKTYIYNGAIATYPYLSSDPTGLSKSVPLTEDAVLAMLSKAMGLIEQKDFTAAREICLDIVNNYSDSYAAYNALGLLTQTYDLNEKETTKLNYKTLFNKGKKKLNAVAGLILAELDKGNKLKVIDEVISKFKDDTILEDALFAKFIYYLNDVQDKENARLIANELDKSFPNSLTAFDAHNQLGDKEYLQKSYPFTSPDQGQKENMASSLPTEYGLFANYPNPFNPSTTINYQLPKSGSVTLKIFDMLGNEVKTLVNGQKEAGTYTVQFDASSLASGTYVYQLRVNDYTSTKKMLLLK